MDTQDLKNLIEGVNILYKCRGGNKKPIKEEESTINFAYSSVVTIKDIKKGEKFTMENIWVKRPGTGEILAKDFNSILGKKSTTNLKNDTQLKLSDINN